MELALIPTRSLQKLHRHVGLLPYLTQFAISLQETHFQMHFKFYVCWRFWRVQKCQEGPEQHTMQRIPHVKGSCIWKDVNIWNNNVLGSQPAHAVFTLKGLHGQRSLALLWSQETRLQKLPVCTFVVQNLSWRTWTTEPWIIHINAHICITQLFGCATERLRKPCL